VRAERSEVAALDTEGNIAISIAINPTDPTMTDYSVATAKNALSKLIDQALEGEEVVITRHGKPVVELKPTPARSTSSVGTYAWLAARRRARPGVGLTSVQILDLVYETDEP
jgi:prevent-host-death family protein